MSRHAIRRYTRVQHVADQLDVLNEKSRDDM